MNAEPPSGPNEDLVEELHQLLLRLYPDPVDVFEDELAEGLSLRRHPECGLEEWRQIRVRFLDASDGGDEPQEVDRSD